ncbi:MAG: efflux RND transporter periplasmic adaptor subunit, partial [Pseudomonadota bacterium]
KARHEAAVDALAERTIDAPFAGTVGLKDVDVGDRVSEGTLLTTLDDLSTVEIEFSVPELYYGAIERGMNVSIRTLAFGRKRFRGSISQIDTRIDPVTRSFRIIADVPNEAQEIPAGMFMNVSVTLNEREAIVISQDALVARGEESFVYVVRDGVARERLVELGLRRRLTVEIADGLEAGDEVVVKGIQNLRDGAAVRVVTSAPDDQAKPAGASGS